jgi:aminoglycoside phosphotransferase (APT) family kinase protein
MSDQIVAPEVRDLDELARSFGAWVQRRMPYARELRVVNLSYPRGAGQSHETILFDAQWQEDGAARTQGCVLRIKPRGFTVYPDNLFDQQYQIMRHLHDDGRVKVARPLWFEPDPGLIGAPFFVMEKVVGRVPVSIPPYAKSGWLADASPEQRRRLWQNAATQLALIQQVPLSGLDFLAGAHGLRGMAQEWDKYVRFVIWVEEKARQPVLTDALQRLKSLWPANQPEGPVWGDARIGNMMFGDNFEVLAVMDWEQPSLGGALHDLAWFLVLSEVMHGRNAHHGGHLEGMGSREETIALWERVTGKSAADIAWYEDFTHLKMSCLAVRMAGLRGAPPPDPSEMARRLKVA